MDHAVPGCHERGDRPHKVTNFHEKYEITFCSASPPPLCTSRVTQQTKADLERSAESSSPPRPQDSMSGRNDQQKSLGEAELALITEFFELLAEWEQKEERS